MNSQITKNALAKVILSINNKENYGLSITKKTGMAYSTVHKILKKLKQEKFIEFNKIRRLKIITLTNKGIKLKDLLTEIKNL